ncbi:MAG: hypothetical protein ACREBU_06470 [Nitrososphaera sp.]
MSEQSEIREGQPSPETLQECEERGIEREDCSDITILKTIHRQPVLDKAALERQRNALEASFTVIGIGASGAAVAAIIAIKKLK